MIAITQVRRLVRKARCLEQTQYDLGVTPVLHTHQALVVDRNGQLASGFESLLSISVLFSDQNLLIRYLIL